MTGLSEGRQITIYSIVHPQLPFRIGQKEENGSDQDDATLLKEDLTR